MKKKDLKQKRIMIIAILIILILIISFIVFKIVSQKKNDIESNIIPVIYFSKDGNLNIPINEDDKFFSNNIKIVWTEECEGLIKKDGKEVSKNNNTELLQDGNYEILVKSPDNKNKITRNFVIDTTPPQVEIKRNSSGSCTIIFEDINDIESAMLTKYNSNQSKEERNLVEEGLKKEIEIKESGKYILRLTDKHKNSTNDNLKFTVK